MWTLFQKNGLDQTFIRPHASAVTPARLQALIAPVKVTVGANSVVSALARTFSKLFCLVRRFFTKITSPVTAETRNG